MKKSRSNTRRRARQALPREKVLLDQLQVEIYVPSRLSARKARKISATVEAMLRRLEPLLEEAARSSARTKPGEIAVRVGNGSDS